MNPETLSRINVIAVKYHKCNFCGGKIEKGTQYQRQGIVFEHRVYTWKSHYRCLDLCSKLNMYDNCDDGVTGDDFYEYVNEEYYKILGENDEPAKRSFQERLDIVCKHHQIS